MASAWAITVMYFEATSDHSHSSQVGQQRRLPHGRKPYKPHAGVTRFGHLEALDLRATARARRQELTSQFRQLGLQRQITRERERERERERLECQ